MNHSNTDIPPSTKPSRPASGYCLRCGEMLHPPTLSRCPQCLLQFNPDDPQTYAADRERFQRLKCWLPGFCLSVVVGVGSYAVLAVTGEMSAALFVAVPMAFGALLGYTVRVTPVWLVVLAITAVVTVACTIVLVNLAGLFCGFTLSIVFLGPAMRLAVNLAAAHSTACQKRGKSVRPVVAAGFNRVVTLCDLTHFRGSPEFTHRDHQRPLQQPPVVQVFQKH